ncbi:hypothetical protein BFG52_16110 [Acinetobacter larvae]|uniref:Fimbrial protein n=2 Tax=Acinetobacter larvae TaxID=1789224 RepID=A0A1B2M4E3_9GAMM|nr:hypothetical protein BFG52_16110 [Acinetobacter larvae]
MVQPLARLFSGALLYAVGSMLYAAAPMPEEDEYIFDPNIFAGRSAGHQALLQRMSQTESVMAGPYKVDVYLNGQLLERLEVQFVQKTTQRIEPCFDEPTLRKFALAQKNIDIIQSQSQSQSQSQGCIFLADYVAGTRIEFDSGKLRLDVFIPQSELRAVPRGYVDPAMWDAGEGIFFINYAGHYYESRLIHQQQSQAAQQYRAAYLALQTGFNVGKWQYRQQSHIQYSQTMGTQWANIRRVVSRPLAGIKSVLNMGEIYSAGRFFSGMAFYGINLASEERMLPESMRGYAPVVQGIAKSNAKISIVQNQKEIYQTTVAAGPFVIQDLYPTSFNGDLLLVIEEADGELRYIKVPFAAMPESLRPGASRYHWDVGQTRQGQQPRFFSNLTYQRGVSNRSTVHVGARVARDYYATAAGAVYSTAWGAFAVNFTHSQAKLIEQPQPQHGHMLQLSYSQKIATSDTTLNMAVYRYGGQGYLDLNDVIDRPRKKTDADTVVVLPVQQRHLRYELSLNQNLAEFGLLFLSASAQKARDRQHHDVQFQLGYAKTFANGLSFNVSLLHQNIVDPYQTIRQASRTGLSLGSTGKESTLNVSLSYSLGRAKSYAAKNLGLNYSQRQHQPASYQTSLSGTLGPERTLSYSIGVQQQPYQAQPTWVANIAQRFAYVATGLHIAKSPQSWQVSSNVQGALAVHRGGITLGPYLGDSFVLVAAPGARGARVMSGQTRINRSGYALIPAITPYRYNEIILDPAGMSERVELLSQQHRVAPYAGATVKVNFATRIGYPLFIQTHLPSGEFVPLGAEVIDAAGHVLGMVGQSGQMYVRVSQREGALRVRWGDDATQQCTFAYALTAKQLEWAQDMIRLEKNCQSEGLP